MGLKRLWRIALAAVLVFGLLPPAGIAASAESSVPEKVLFDLSSFGIIKEDEGGGYDPGRIATRAEFSAILVRALGMDAWGISTAPLFVDVTPSDWFYHEVSILVLSGIVNGYGDGYFRPDEPVSPEAAAKMLVKALGYDFKAEAVGGYPFGYTVIAAELGLFKGLSLSGASATRGDLFIMLYNSLDVPLMKPVYGDTDSYIIDEGSTIRSLHDYSDGSGTFSKSSGIVEATVDIKPYTNNLKDDQVVIGGVVYNIGNTNAVDYFGMEVDFYFSAPDDSGPYTLERIAPTLRNKVIILTEQEFLRCEGSGTVHYEKNGKTASVKLASEYVYINNLRPVYSFIPGDITLEKGLLTLIDNDGDGEHDVVIIEEYESFVIENIVGNALYFFGGAKYKGQGLLRIDLESNEKRYVLLNTDGSAASFEDIVKNSVISIISDINDAIFKIYISNETVSGIVQEYSSSDGLVTVNDETYKTESGAVLDINLSEECDFYLTFRNEIAYIKVIQDTVNYAYVLDWQRETPFSGLSLKLIIPGQIYDETKKESDEEDAASVVVLKGCNLGLKIVNVRSNVTWGGKKTSHNDIMKLFERENRLIKYKEDAKGEIIAFQIPEMIGMDIFSSATLKRAYNSRERVFGGPEDRDVFGVKDATKVICLPEDADGITSEDDYLAKIALNNNDTYNVNGYDVIAEDGCARLILIRETLKYDTSATFDETKIGVLEQTSRVLDEEGNETVKLVYWAEGAVKTGVVDEKVADGLPSLSFGDVFRYSINLSTDKINGVQIISRPVSFPKMGEEIDETDRTRSKFLGYPVKVDYNFISSSSTRRVDRIYLYLNDDLSLLDEELNQTEKIDVNIRNPQLVYVVDKSAKTVSAGSTRDIVAAGGSIRGADMLFTYKSNNTLRVVVIVRD
jgi:hypothetical protein